MKKHLRNFFVILVFSLVGMKALFHPGLYSAHDIWHQVARLYWYTDALKAGQIPPYWISNLANGFGYPLFIFSYHLPWIVAQPFLALEATIPNTLKTLFILAYFFSGVSMYFFANALFKNRLAALISSILYLWAPYHFLVILVSASMGVTWVFVFLPILLLGIYKTGERSGILLTAIGLAGIILSHLATFLSLTPLIGIFTLYSLYIQKDKFKFLKNLILGILLGIALSAFYFIPALFYSNLIRGTTELYKNNFVNFFQLIYSKWGYGIINQSAKEGAISFQIGIAQWLAFLGAIFAVFKLRKNQRFLAITLILAFAISILAMLDISRPVWDLVVKVVRIDYPTRFMLPAVFSSSLMAGLLYSQIKSIFKLFAFSFLLLVALYTNRNHLRVNMYTDYPVSLYVESEITTTSFHEYLPKGADIELLSEKREEAISQFSFPGQTLYIDGIKTNYSTDEKGLIKFNTPKGNHKILIKFEETPLIKASKLITLAGILILLATLLYSLKSGTKKQDK